MLVLLDHTLVGDILFSEVLLECLNFLLVLGLAFLHFGIVLLRQRLVPLIALLLLLTDTAFKAFTLNLVEVLQLRQRFFSLPLSTLHLTSNTVLTILQ